MSQPLDTTKNTDYIVLQQHGVIALKVVNQAGAKKS